MSSSEFGKEQHHNTAPLSNTDATLHNLEDIRNNAVPPPFQNLEMYKNDISFENDMLTKNSTYPSKSDIKITTPPVIHAVLPLLKNLTPQATQSTPPPFQKVEKSKSDILFEMTF